jgi:hypothetical protein
MSEAEARLAEDRIDTAEKRLVALHDVGIDTAALRSQLAFARTCLSEGKISGIAALCDEVLAAAKRLAEGAASGGTAKTRTDRITRDRLGEEVRAVLSQGLLARLLAEQQALPDPRLDARLQALETGVATRLQAAQEALEQVQRDAQAEITALRAELKGAHDLLAEARGALAAAAQASAERTSSVLERVAEQAAAQQERLLSTLSGGLEHLSAAIIQQPAAAVPTSALGTAASQAPAILPATAEQAAAPSSEQTAQALERFTTQASGQQERLVQVLQEGWQQLGAAIAARAPASGDAAAAAQQTMLQGLATIAAAIRERPAISEAQPADGAPAAPDQVERLVSVLQEGWQQLGAAIAQCAPTAGEPAAALQETLLQGLSGIAAAIRERPASNGELASESVAAHADVLAFERMAVQAAGQHERLLSALSAAMERLGGLMAKPQPQPLQEGYTPSQDVQMALIQGIERLIEALARRPVAAAPAPAGGDADGPVVSEHETTRVFQSVSTRTEKPAVQAPDSHRNRRSAGQDARMLDTGRMRQLVADEVGQQITDRQSGAEPITIYDPEQVRQQVVRRGQPPAGRFDPTRSLGSRSRPQGSRHQQAAGQPAARTAGRGTSAPRAVLADRPRSGGQPRSLGELTGLRSFLRHELALAAEELARDAQPA